ncbi:MAG: GGDEF domain-containing protein [Treponema sp.]|nr:GGDEF domain-containing protein [Treponema sp.]
MVPKNKFTVGKKIYLFVGLTVFLAVFGAAMISYRINASQIDDYFKNLSLYSARNFSKFIDAEYLFKLKEVVISEEYQALRDQAEKDEDEAVIERYLKQKGLWTDYVKNRNFLIRYLRTMEDIKYLYLIVWGDVNATKDMYLMDDDENPLYVTGRYEDRAESFYGVDASMDVEPTISNSGWGWLCSSYVPVYDKAGNLVCQVGCDVEMDDIIRARRRFLMYVLASAVIFTILVLIGAILLLNRIVIKPMTEITKEMKRFSPSSNKSYEDSGVLNLNIKSNDEIEDIYNGIRSMQIRILDYLKDIVEIRAEKEKVESDIESARKEMGAISREAYRDSLTKVGNKSAYLKKAAELQTKIGDDAFKFGIVMVDVNFLKTINDTYGHSMGDDYLKGCCKIICQIYKHSPVFRIGGDEFVVLLIGEDFENRKEKLSQAENLFERSFNDSKLEPWLRYSAAIGMAESSASDRTVEEVFKRADKAMYDEKMNFKKNHGVDDIRG